MSGEYTQNKLVPTSGASTSSILTPVSEHKRFNSEEIPEFYHLTERLNSRLIDMADKGVIKYGQRGDLEGKIRLDLSKTYDYYAETNKTDPIIAYTIKEIMDEWRENHTRRGGWVRMNQLFGLRDKEVYREFSNTSYCAKKATTLNAEKDRAWDEYLDCTRKADEKARQITQDITVHQIPKKEIKQQFTQYVNEYPKHHKVDARRLTGIKKYLAGDQMIRNEETKQLYNTMFKDFLTQNFNTLIKPEYQKYKGQGGKIREIEALAAKDKLKQTGHDIGYNYQTGEGECKPLYEAHEQASKRYSNHTYHPPCHDELKEITKETYNFCNWTAKQTLKNLWRQ